MQTFISQNYFTGNNLVKGTLTIANQKFEKIDSSTPFAAHEELIVPGFIDLQIYGSGEKLFSAAPSLETIADIEQDLLKKGTTGFLICLATNTPAVFNKCIEVIKQHKAKNCLGLHLEGPFINPKKRGAHVLEYIRKATLDEIKALLDFGDGTIKMMTLAPETQDDATIQYLLDNGVIVSLGHSDATFEQATKAYNQGVQTTTHLFNAMSPLHHRNPGIPTAVFNHPKAMASIIADGYHVDFEVVKAAKKIMGERLYFITDAVTDCNIGPYQHKAVDGKFILPDGTLSGSAITMLDAIKNGINYCGITLEEALKMATLYPAKLINQADNIGVIKVNADANFVVLDKDLNLKQVFYKGHKI